MNSAMNNAMNNATNHAMKHAAPSTRHQRGFVMIAVLVVVAAAILVATGAIFAARGATVSSRAADLERRMRDAALDGVALAADLIARDREKILAGASPSGDALLLDIPDGDRHIEVRLVALWSGEFFGSEAAKLDANQSPIAMLEKATEDGSEIAQQIIAQIATRRPLSSIDAAASFAAPGQGADTLNEVFGSMSTIGDERDELDEGPRGNSGATAGGGASSDRGSVPPLIELLTVHGAEPLVDLDGAPRLDLIAAFGAGGSGDRATASLSQFEDTERIALERVAKDAKEGADDGAIARALLAKGIDLARIDDILSTCTLQAGTHGVARLDIVRADVRALAALDGLGADAAARIVDLRDSLDETERKGTSWLVSRRVLTNEQFGAVAGRITNRSALWRLRVEARIVAASDDETGLATATASQGDEPRGAYAFDCVVDVSTDPARIAFLRDISMLPTARALDSMVSDGDSRRDLGSTADQQSASDDTRTTGRPGSVADGSLDEETDGSQDADIFRRSADSTQAAPSSFDLKPREATIPLPPTSSSRAARSRVGATGRDIGGGGSR
jgi:DNA uptake protein ComE-like DNA-binding protein